MPPPEIGYRTALLAWSERDDLDIVEADGDLPIVETEMIVAWAGEGLGIGKLEHRSMSPIHQFSVLPSARSILKW